MTETLFQRLNYQRLDYNGGAFTGYRKAFGPERDALVIGACYLEVRFREYKDGQPRAYMVFPSVIVPLPGIETATQVEDLWERMERAIKPLA